MFSILSCLAPKAEQIEGDIAAVIERGIEQGDRAFDHRVWDEILVAYSHENGKTFDYSGLKSEEGKLDAYLDDLSKVDLATLNKNDIFALFANAYNAYTVRTILNHVSDDGTYRIQSIRDIPDVFDLATHRVGGFTLSLNNIEHNILRPFFKDPRIHFAVNCASASCPPLPTRAFTAESIDEQLEVLTRNALSSDDFVRVEGDALVVTKLLKWYGSDFVTKGYVGAEKDLVPFILKYAREDVRDWIESQPPPVGLEFMDYDWTLNKYE
jgi:hypothetical protein